MHYTARTVPLEGIADQMTRRQSVVRRSSEVEPAREGCWAARARTAGGATMTAVTASGEQPKDVFVLSVREWLDTGAGAGAEPLLTHGHGPPLERPAPWPRQPQVDPVPPPQQPPGRAERAAALPHEDCRARGPPLQCGHVATGAASAGALSSFTARAEWSAQLHAIRGRDSTGTSTAASQRRTLAVILLQNRTAGPRGLEWLGNSRRLP